MKNTFDDGEWVTIKAVKGSLAYVEKMNNEGYQIKIVKHRNRKMVGESECVDFRDISPPPIIQTRQGVEQMIELALMTEDKKWFEELMALMQSDHLVSY